MSDWKTHLYCAHKVNEALGFEGKDLDMFLYGNLFPDINMGWIITPGVKLKQATTHFDGVGQEYFWVPLKFYDKYKDLIDSRNPLLLGYLFHLWLDVKFMTDFVSRMPMSKIINERKNVREWKWNDSRLFINKYRFTLSDENHEEIVEAAKLIEEVQVSLNDLAEVKKYVDNLEDEVEEGEYIIYSEDVFEQFYEQVCSDFIGWING